MSVSAALEEKLGLVNLGYRHNLSKDALFYEALRNDRGRVRFNGPDDEAKAFATRLGIDGPLMFYTDPACTGRPVDDTFGVAWPRSRATCGGRTTSSPSTRTATRRCCSGWWRTSTGGAGALYVQDVYAGADPAYSVPYRFVGEFATHAMFALNMFPKAIRDRGRREQGLDHAQRAVLSLRAGTRRTRSDRAAIIDFRNRLCLVAGRADYCGLVKKTIFTVMNYLLPRAGLPLHALLGEHRRAGRYRDPVRPVGHREDHPVRDPDRRLIGDDEAGVDRGGGVEPGGRLLREAHRSDKKAER